MRLADRLPPSSPTPGRDWHCAIRQYLQRCLTCDPSFFRAAQMAALSAFSVPGLGERRQGRWGAPDRSLVPIALSQWDTGLPPDQRPRAAGHFFCANLSALEMPDWRGLPSRCGTGREGQVSGIVVGIDGSRNASHALEWAMTEPAPRKPDQTVHYRSFCSCRLLDSATSILAGDEDHVAEIR